MATMVADEAEHAAVVSIRTTCSMSWLLLQLPLEHPLSSHPRDEEIAALRLEVAALRFERDLLLAQRDATRQWLGEQIKGTPLDPDQPLSLTEYARSLARSAPPDTSGQRSRIIAIKQLRVYSTTVPPKTALGLKEAKDMIDAAFEGRKL